MIKTVLDKILSHSIEEPVETILYNLQNYNEHSKNQNGYRFLLLSIQVNEDSYNKMPTLKKLADGVLVRENPFINYDFIGLLEPGQINENQILDKWIWAYQKILNVKSFLKISLQHPYLEIEGALIDVVKKFNPADYLMEKGISGFVLPIKIRLKVKVREKREEIIKAVKERNIKLTKQV